MNTNVCGDFQICISVPLIFFKINIYNILIYFLIVYSNFSAGMASNKLLQCAISKSDQKRFKVNIL